MQFAVANRVLTIAAPCVLPVLPVIVGGSIARTSPDAKVADRQWFRPVVIAVGLVLFGAGNQNGATKYVQAALAVAKSLTVGQGEFVVNDIETSLKKL